jgi:UDP-N-acetylglucosamine 4,6-dehydratase
MKSILITGATGSFGQAFFERIISSSDFHRVIVFSRDELKQYEMSKYFAGSPFFEKFRFFLGDIRDLHRLNTAMYGVDVVVHAAALKQVDTAEYNPTEFIKTNIIGSQNVIDAAVNNNVKKVVALSTDKASSPVNLYGATKLTADKLFLSANNFYGDRSTKFSVVRYGNVFGSRGSVVPLFLKHLASGTVPKITDKRMTRFWITMEEALNLVLEAIEKCEGGELIVPKIPSARVMDIFDAFNFKAKPQVSGIRPGEKLHEEMISQADAYRTYEFEKTYVIFSAIHGEIPKSAINSKVIDGFSYNSETNSSFLSSFEIRDQIESKYKIKL